MIVYFSGTGNSKYIARHLATCMKDKAYSLIDCVKEGKVIDLHQAHLGIVCPVYGWGIPRPVVELLPKFFNLCKLQAPNYIYALLTCGDDIGLTDIQLSEIVKKEGLNLKAVASVQMPETYIALPFFHLDALPQAEQKIDKALNRVALLASQFAKNEVFVDINRGAMPWIYSKVLYPIFDYCLINDHFFRVTKQCIHCGHCVEVCPIGNIKMIEGKNENHKEPCWQHHCIGCLACYHHCPTNAIQYLFSKGKGQWTLKN